MSGTYVVRLPSGRYLGRTTVSAPLVSVQRAFAYTWDDLALAQRLAAEHDGEVEAA